MSKELKPVGYRVRYFTEARKEKQNNGFAKDFDDYDEAVRYEMELRNNEFVLTTDLSVVFENNDYDRIGELLKKNKKDV